MKEEALDRTMWRNRFGREFGPVVRLMMMMMMMMNPSDRIMALGVDSASNRNEYQEHFLGVKAAGA